MATAKELGLGNQMYVGNIRLAKSSFNVTGASDLDVGWAGIGQYTTRINPCQMLTIAGAVANGGSSGAAISCRQNNLADRKNDL